MRALAFILVFQLTFGIAVAGAPPSGSGASGTQLNTMIALDGALSTVVPADWTLDDSLEYDYVGEDGFMLVEVVPTHPGRGLDLIADSCKIAANYPAFAAGQVTTPFVWRSQSTCLIESPVGVKPHAVATVIRNDQAQAQDTLVIVLADSAHFEMILQAITMGLDGMSLPEILNAAIDEIARRSTLRDRLDWPILRDEALILLEREMAGHVDEPLVFPILWILNALIQHGADGHNTIFQPGQLRESADPSERHVRVEVISDGIGYLDVPGNGNSLESLDEYATQLQDAVNSVKQPSCGWIIDLRNNEGGNLFAMLSGLAGVHRGATVEFMDATGAITRATAYADGSAQIETPLFGTLTRLYGTPQDPFTNGDDMLPIAVLVGPQTASAAEALALALINRGNVRLFGQVTSGDTSAPMAITLSDAHAVSISAAWFLDEHRNIVSTGIAPDEIVSEGNVSQGSELSSSPASNRAVEWLTSTFECAP